MFFKHNKKFFLQSLHINRQTGIESAFLSTDMKCIKKKGKNPLLYTYTYEKSINCRVQIFSTILLYFGRVYGSLARHIRLNIGIKGENENIVIIIKENIFLLF